MWFQSVFDCATEGYSPCKVTPAVTELQGQSKWFKGHQFLSHSCLIQDSSCPEKDIIWTRACVALISFSTDAFTDVQGANSIDTNAPIYHQRCRFMNWALIRRSLEAISMLSKMKLHSCFKQFSTLTQKGQQHYWIMFTYNLFFAQQNFNLYLWMIQWTVVRDN